MNYTDNLKIYMFDRISELQNESVEADMLAAIIEEFSRLIDKMKIDNVRWKHDG